MGVVIVLCEAFIAFTSPPFRPKTLQLIYSEFVFMLWEAAELTCFI